MTAELVAADIERKRLGLEALDDGHDFRIQLATLIGGWGQALQVQILYFKFKTSFPIFLTTLKYETGNSKIPPENITPPAFSYPFITFGDEVETNNKTSNTISSTLDTKSPEQGVNGNSNGKGISPERIESIQSPSATTGRDPNDKGYNLSDGPWMYRLPHVGKDSDPRPVWRPIRDKNDYMIMLDGVNAVNSKYKEWGDSSKCSITMIHVNTLPTITL
ncbi:hypothetical protein NHQ30_010386 [Ciborinia camelliae]|nr:hypothetical protein NHQ30_010386 [Ciborinia camelliae]